MIKELMEQIQDAEYVLVGIGEEFQVDYKGILQIPEFQPIMQECEKNKELSWVQPYLIHEYIRKEKFPLQEQAYKNIAKLLVGKDYYVVTTCTDDLIFQSDLDPNRVVAPCGSFYQMQCENGCGAEVEDGEDVAFAVTQDILEHFNELQKIARPRCEKCGANYVFNTIFEEKYDENGYLVAWKNYNEWLQKTVNRKLVILELGVGLTFPSVIRFPFEKTSYFNKKSHFYRINDGIFQLSEQSEKRGMGLHENALSFINKLQ